MAKQVNRKQFKAGFIRYFIFMGWLSNLNQSAKLVLKRTRTLGSLRPGANVLEGVL